MPLNLTSDKYASFGGLARSVDEQPRPLDHLRHLVGGDPGEGKVVGGDPGEGEVVGGDPGEGEVIGHFTNTKSMSCWADMLGCQEGRARVVLSHGCRAGVVLLRHGSQNLL